VRRGLAARCGLLAALGVLSVLALPAAGAFGHGEEGEAAAEIPARTLVQQALALLTQQDNATEAQEKLEAALQSKDQEGVQIASVRDALEAIEKDEHEEAVGHMNEALAPAEAAGEKQVAGEEGAGPEETTEPAPGALEHAEEFEPERGAAEWVGFGVGIALIGLAGVGLLARGRAGA